MTEALSSNLDQWSNIVNTNIFHYFKRKITIYVLNFTQNSSIFKIKRNENISWRNLCIYTLITDDLQRIKLFLFKVLLYKKEYLEDNHGQ